MTNESLSVLHIDTERQWRGGQAQVFELCRGLSARGICAVVVCPPESALSERCRKEGVEVEEVEMRGEWDFRAISKVRKCIKRHGISLVHAQTSHAHALGLMATRGRPDISFVVSRRVDFPVARGFFGRRKYLHPRVTYFAISEGVKRVLLDGGVPQERVRVVPSGVNPEKFTYQHKAGDIRSEFNLSEQSLMIGNVGALTDHKGHVYLVRAMPTVLKNHPDARLFIVGEGELRSDLEEEIRRQGLEGKVFLTGFRDDVERFLAGFDLFVLSSHLEGLCTSILDAMLLSVPVVATRTGGVPDVVKHGETGVLVEPKSPDALANGIEAMFLNEANRLRMAESARQFVLDNFTSDRMTENTISAYRDLMNG